VIFLFKGKTGIENILDEARMIKEVEKELPNYNMSMLLQYLEFHEEFLDEKARDFLNRLSAIIDILWGGTIKRSKHDY
jgi:hypothetical protein